MRISQIIHVSYILQLFVYLEYTRNRNAPVKDDIKHIISNEGLLQINFAWTEAIIIYYLLICVNNIKLFRDTAQMFPGTFYMTL